jgi:hypothetical protein
VPDIRGRSTFRADPAGHHGYGRKHSRPRERTSANRSLIARCGGADDISQGSTYASIAGIIVPCREPPLWAPPYAVQLAKTAPMAVLAAMIETLIAVELDYWS